MLCKCLGDAGNDSVSGEGKKIEEHSRGKRREGKKEGEEDRNTEGKEGK